MAAVTARADSFRTALHAAARAATSDRSTPVISAIRLGLSPDGRALCVSATDRRVALIARVECEHVELSGADDALLDLSNVPALVKALPRKGIATLAVSGGVAVAAGEGPCVTFPPVEGDYPDVAGLFAGMAAAIGEPVAARAVQPDALAILTDLKPEAGWIIGQMPGSPDGPIVAAGTAAGVQVAVLVMPLWVTDRSLSDARALVAGVSGAES